MSDLVPITPAQFMLVMNVLNLSIALFAGFSLLFLLLRRNVGHHYGISVALMSAVTAMAGYHYFRLYSNWLAAFTLHAQAALPTGLPFNYVFRYADWIGTVPLLLSAIMLVLDLGREKSASLVTRMVVSALLMIGLGYVGELEHGNLTARAVWGGAAMLPFFYILWVLWGEMTQVLAFESLRVRRLFSALRLALLASWVFYPLIYALPFLQVSGPAIITLVQVANSAADLLAKVGVGLFVLAIAREKTEEDILAGRLSHSSAQSLEPVPAPYAPPLDPRAGYAQQQMAQQAAAPRPPQTPRA